MMSYPLQSILQLRISCSYSCKWDAFGPVVRTNRPNRLFPRIPGVSSAVMEPDAADRGLGALRGWDATAHCEQSHEAGPGGAGAWRAVAGRRGCCRHPAESAAPAAAL